VTAVRQAAKLHSLGSRLGDEMSDADDSYTKIHSTAASIPNTEDPIVHTKLNASI
jgi:hypothetical protein